MNLEHSGEVEIPLPCDKALGMEDTQAEVFVDSLLVKDFEDEVLDKESSF